jgi:hypothetical protein
MVNERGIAMKQKDAASFYDKDGRLYVDCAQCERGGNGTDTDRCSAGWQTKRTGYGGCFAGVLMTGIAPGNLCDLENEG